MESELDGPFDLKDVYSLNECLIRNYKNSFLLGYFHRDCLSNQFLLLTYSFQGNKLLLGQQKQVEITVLKTVAFRVSSG